MLLTGYVGLSVSLSLRPEEVDEDLSSLRELLSLLLLELRLDRPDLDPLSCSHERNDSKLPSGD